MSNDLIEKRDERTRKRKQVKRKMDSVIGLSFHDKDKKVMSVSADLKALSAEKARLIDEGYIDNGFVIKKGALEKYLNGKNQYVRGWEFDGEEYKRTEVLNLTPDFKGTVNLGHFDFSVMPFILGTWTKDDLTLVETENDRHALDIQLHLDEGSIFVQELKRQEHDIGISAEFWVHQNDEDTQALSEMLGYYMPVFDEIFIFAYGLVGECGNVNSSGLELNKEIIMAKETINLNAPEEAVTVTEEATQQETLSAEQEIQIPVEAAEETPNEVNEQPSEEGEDGSENLTISEEAVNTEEAETELVVSDEGEGDEATLSNVLETIENLTKEIGSLKDTVKTLTEANAELKKSNRKLQNKLKSERDAKEQFLNEVKDISVELLPNETKKVTKELVADRSYLYGDGIVE